MSRRAVILGSILGALVIVISTVVVRTMSAAGQFTTIKPIGVEACRPLAEIAGAEDIVVDRQAGIAFVSSTDRKALHVDGKSDIRGEIYSLDLKQDNSAPQSLTALTPADFRPHGVSLLRVADGSRFLFAVNHPSSGRHSVERWRITDNGLEHLGSTTDVTMLGSPNDVAAVGPEQFYVTNDGGGSALTRTLDFVLQRTRSTVVYFDGGKARVVAEGFGFANGVSVSADGKTVYVADTFRRSLEIFERESTSGSLKPTGSVFFGTGVDNIDIDPDDALWIAAHPRLIDFVRYFSGGLRISPSQITRAAPTGAGRDVRTVLLDLGETVSAASVAVRFGDRYLVGTVSGPAVLSCDFKTAG